MKNLLTTFALAACFAAAQTPTTDALKGVFLDNGTAGRTAMRFNIQLDRGSTHEVVPTSYAFQSDDKMKFQFELNRDRYIYLLLHSVSGDAATVEAYSGTRGIEVIREKDRKAKIEDSYQLLYPTEESGTNNKVSAHVVKTLPQAESRTFRMDRKPGMEKLFVVISETPVDFSTYFDLKTGRMRGGPAGAKTALDDEALGKLTRMLMELGGNAQVAAARGVVIDAYAAAANPSRPMLVPVDLRHTAKAGESR